MNTFAFFLGSLAATAFSQIGLFTAVIVVFASRGWWKWLTVAVCALIGGLIRYQTATRVSRELGFRVDSPTEFILMLAIWLIVVALVSSWIGAKMAPKRPDRIPSQPVAGLTDFPSYDLPKAGISDLPAYDGQYMLIGTGQRFSSDEAIGELRGELMRFDQIERNWMFVPQHEQDALRKSLPKMMAAVERKRELPWHQARHVIYVRRGMVACNDQVVERGGFFLIEEEDGVWRQASMLRHEGVEIDNAAALAVQDKFFGPRE